MVLGGRRILLRNGDPVNQIFPIIIIFQQGNNNNMITMMIWEACFSYLFSFAKVENQELVSKNKAIAGQTAPLLNTHEQEGWYHQTYWWPYYDKQEINAQEEKVKIQQFFNDLQVYDVKK